MTARRKWCWWAVLIAVTTVMSCWALPARAGQAERLWAKAAKLLNQGRELEACKVVAKMAPYSETAVYAKASRILLKRGISIETPLTSWTVKQMLKLQNRIEHDLRATGDMPLIGPAPDFQDAWGRPIRVEMVEKPGVLYFIRSAGPDGRLYTADDAVVVGKDRYNIKRKKQSATRRSSWGKGDRTVPPPQNAGPSGEPGVDRDGEESEDVPADQVVELEELLKRTE